jgi:DNA-binding MarR family transcriptional regulator
MPKPNHAELAQTLRELAMSFVREAPRSSLSRTAAGTLSRLDVHGPLRVTALSELETVTQPAMTGLVQRLESAGLVERLTDPDDGRASLIAITDSGHESLMARRRQQDAAIATRLAQLSPDELATLVAAAPALSTLIHVTETHELVR